MSSITDVILTIGPENYIEHNKNDGPDSFPVIDEVNSYLTDPDRGGYRTGLVSTEVTGVRWGGDKIMMPVFIGAFNYLDLDSFMDHIKQCIWEAPECVRVFIKGDQDSEYRTQALTIKAEGLIPIPNPCWDEPKDTTED